MAKAAERRPRITVIDDHQEFLDLMQELLAPAYDVVTFSGHDLSPDDILDSRPDLLIVDLLLDRRDLQGWDVVTLVGAHRHLRTVPIIVCSADLRALADHSAAIGSGPMAFLAKPFTLDTLSALVKRGLTAGFDGYAEADGAAHLGQGGGASDPERGAAAAS